MRRVVSGLLVGCWLAVAPRAGAEEPTPCGPGASASATEGREEVQTFELALQRFEKLWDLTQSLLEERERKAFEEATEHYERFAALTRELALRNQAAEEKAFDESVSLYLKKRDLTASLARLHASSAH